MGTEQNKTKQQEKSNTPDLNRDLEYDFYDDDDDEKINWYKIQWNNQAKS